MNEESASRKRGMVMFSGDQSYDGVQMVYSEDEDMWHAFLEGPLSAASKAMMSLNGDEGGSSSLGLLYDYYKNPRAGGIQIKTENIVSEELDSSKINFLVPHQDSLLTMTPLTNVPLHSVIHGSPSILGRKGGPYPQSFAPPPTYSATLHSFPGVADPATGHSSQMQHLGFSQSPDHRNLDRRTCGPGTPALTPGSTSTEPSSKVFPLSDKMHLSSISPEELYSSKGRQFEHILEAPLSLRPKTSSGPMSYLNKGQFYPITLRQKGGAPAQHNHTIRSVVMLVFGEEKVCDDQLKHWRFWQSRQHTIKQRCLDIADYKESFNTISNMEEIAYNAISFTWDSRSEARIFISVNCLSTDFSPQKGVRGLPLNLQIDSYVCGSHGDLLVHRAAGQVKVFCDKGAERKIRDEERKQTRRRLKGLDGAPAVEDLVRYLDITVFKSVSDLESQPVLFIPESQICALQRNVGLSGEDVESSGQRRPLCNGEQQIDPNPAKRLRQSEPHRVLLYVRREEEEVFDALMLKTATLSSLLEAVNEKYDIPLDRFGKVYKRCKKGILLNMDDNVIQRYSNEDTFQMDLEDVGGRVVLTLTEI